MTTQTLHRADYAYSEAAEHLNLPTATIIDMVNNGTLEHTACGKRITRNSLQAAMAPESEQKWLHGEKADGWIDWPGGECPVFSRAIVEFGTRAGTTGKRLAHELAWQHGMLDIVAYRVVPADQPAEPEKQPQHTPGPWGVEQTESTNWIGPLRVDGKVDRIVAQIDRRCLRPDVLAEADADARLIAQAPSMESTIEECLKQRDEAEAAADELASLILGEPVDWAFHNEAWQRAVQQLKDAKCEADCTLPTTSPHDGCYVVKSEKQPQPGWYMVDDKGPFLYVGPDIDGDPTFQETKDSFGSYTDVVVLRHLPGCTGFDYVPPPEKTPAETRLGELGIERDKDGDYRSVKHRTVLGLSDFTSEQLEAIAAHMREREGGASCS